MEEQYEASVRAFEMAEAKKQVHTRVVPGGSRLVQKLTVRLTDQIKNQLAAFASMEACAGIRGNQSAVYKARVNHYGGISSWGFPLPVRRFIDRAYASLHVNQAAHLVVKSFKPREGKGKWGRANEPMLIKKYLDKYMKAGKGMQEVRTMRVRRSDVDLYLKENDPKYRSLEAKRRAAARGEGLSGKSANMNEYNLISQQVSQYLSQRTKEFQNTGLPVGFTQGELFVKSASEIMEGLASQMARNQIHALNTMYPPNAPATIAIKGFDDPLKWTGEMGNSIESWVNIASSHKTGRGVYEVWE